MQQRYLAHLDGLRAIAVGLVVVYHAGLGVFGAGFIGVDVFFVLSGFLITGQLVQNIQQGKFSFAQFYMRRIRRLAPAMVVVLFTTLLAGAFILLPEDLIYLSRLAGLTVLSLSNFYLANTTGGYFEVATDEIALLHTWSLAVEEQYYLIWPVLLLLFFRSGARFWRPGLLASIFLGSLAFSVWYTQADPMRSYYLLPARFHELFLGAMLAIAFQANKMPAPSRIVRELLSWMGLVLIVVPAVIWDSNIAFPGYLAAIPCLGTALLIYAGDGTSSVNWLLTRRVMLWLGMLSYSLYLWHWPIFSFTTYATGEIQTSHALVGIAAAVLLSHLTWKFVEQPFRFRWTFPPGKTAARLFGIPVLVFGVATVAIDEGDGFINRFDDATISKIHALESEPGKFPTTCNVDKDGLCSDILLLGDSHAQHFGDFIGILAKDAGLAYNVKWRPGCPGYTGLKPLNFKADHVEVDEECPEVNAAALADAGKYRAIVLAGYWSLTDIKGDRYFFVTDENPEPSEDNSNQNIADGLRKTIATIVDAGAKPILIYDNPQVEKRDFKCSRMNLLPFHDAVCSFPREHTVSQQAHKRELFARLAKEFPELGFIDPNAVLCDEESCYTELEDVPLYRDDDHLNQAGSQWLANKMLSQGENPLKQLVPAQ